ncbi:hypothetical protein FRB97_009608 [Tulasnella sp. 331]|nr:hypothetical protein FRB97_009608 [Tulasnella sp. 331]
MSQRTNFFSTLGNQNKAPPSTNTTEPANARTTSDLTNDASSTTLSVLEDTANAPKLNLSKIKKSKKSASSRNATAAAPPTPNTTTTSASACETPQPPPTPSRQRSFITAAAMLDVTAPVEDHNQNVIGLGLERVSSVPTNPARRNPNASDETNTRDRDVARGRGAAHPDSRDSSVATTAYDTPRASTADSISTAGARTFFRQRAPPTPQPSSSSRRTTHQSQKEDTPRQQQHILVPGSDSYSQEHHDCRRSANSTSDPAATAEYDYRHAPPTGDFSYSQDQQQQQNRMPTRLMEEVNADFELYLEQQHQKAEGLRTKWATCTMVEWHEGGKDIIARFSALVTFVGNGMISKKTKLDDMQSRIDQHSETLDERDQLLASEKDVLIKETGRVVAK